MLPGFAAPTLPDISNNLLKDSKILSSVITRKQTWLNLFMYHLHLSTLLLKSLKETLKDILHIINIINKNLVHYLQP